MTAKAFIDAVAQATGLSPVAVADWYLAEQGSFAWPSSNNPLNIGPGRVFATPEAGIAATIQTIESPVYRTTIQAAAHKGLGAELAAIAASPWDAGHYMDNTIGSSYDYPGGKLIEDLPTAAQYLGQSISPARLAQINAEVSGGAGPYGGLAGSGAQAGQATVRAVDEFFARLQALFSVNTLIFILAVIAALVVLARLV